MILFCCEICPFLGNVNSGKSSLLHALQGNDSALQTKPVALDYAYIDVYADDIDGCKYRTCCLSFLSLILTHKCPDFPVTRIHVWQTEGDPEHFDLLKFAQNQQNFEHSCVMIVLDFSKPWDLVVSLNTWLEVLKRHLQSLNLPQEKLNEAKRKCILSVLSHLFHFVLGFHLSS
jgi:dynein light intermediate chain 1